MVVEELVTIFTVLLPIIIAFFAGFGLALLYLRQRSKSLLPLAHSLVFENMKDGVMVIDAAGQILDFNPAAQKIFADQVEALKNQNFDALIKQAIDQETLEYQSQASRAELTVKMGHGRKHTYYLHITPLHRHNQIANGKIIVFMDITNRKKAEEAMRQAKEIAEVARREIEEASQAKTIFFGSVSHELRTPLTVITLYAELIQRTVKARGYDDIYTWVTQIHKSAKHLSDVVTDILDLSKIEAGMMELHEEIFNLEDLLAEIEMMVRPLAARNNNTFRIHTHHDVNTIFGDPIRIRQILLNLLSNAAKFTFDGKINLYVFREPLPYDNGIDALRFEVHDTGIGMTPEQTEKIFAPFKQADDSLAKKYHGTGLGLAISQEFCRMMDGTISVNSQPEQGSTFTVQIPLKLPTTTPTKSV